MAALIILLILRRQIGAQIMVRMGQDAVLTPLYAHFSVQPALYPGDLTAVSQHDEPHASE